MSLPLLLATAVRYKAIETNTNYIIKIIQNINSKYLKPVCTLLNIFFNKSWSTNFTTLTILLWLVNCMS